MSGPLKATSNNVVELQEKFLLAVDVPVTPYSPPVPDTDHFAIHPRRTSHISMTSPTEVSGVVNEESLSFTISSEADPRMKASRPIALPTRVRGAVDPTLEDN